MTRYQVLARRRGKGELRRFNLPVVMFKPRVLYFVYGGGGLMAMTDTGLYLRGGGEVFERPTLSQVTAPASLVSMGSEYYENWAVDPAGNLWKRPNSACDTLFAKVLVPVPAAKVYSDTNYGNHVVFIAQNGDLYGQGWNESYSGGGPLGLGPGVSYVDDFTKLPGVSSVSFVFCYSAQTAAITSNGDLYVTGSNTWPVSGALGLGATPWVDVFTHVPLSGYKAKWGRITGMGTAVVTEDGSVFLSGMGGTTFQRIPGITGAVQALFGWEETHVTILFSDGSVWGVSLGGEKLFARTPEDLRIVSIGGDARDEMIMLDSSGDLWEYDRRGGLRKTQFMPVGEDSCR